MLRNKKNKPKLSVVATKYSQSTPTFYHPEQDDAPYSPTESTSSYISSISGIAEKSASELGLLLKGAYRSLREKEKNLVLAAKVGRSLLEHNQSLESDYNKLLQTMKSFELETKSEDEEESVFNNTMKVISRKHVYDQVIETLERKNAELQETLEQAQEQSKLNNSSYSQKQRKMEAEIEILRQSLEIATQKVQELEEYNQLQQERVRQLDDRKELEQQQNEDLLLLEELTLKMEGLFMENKHLYQSKKSVEEKLMQSLTDLEILKREFENFELTQQNFETLQDAFNNQRLHIQELNDSLEDHRFILSKLRDKGVWSPQRSATPSESGQLSTVFTCLSKQSLFGELENAWNKHSLIKSHSDSNLTAKDSIRYSKTTELMDQYDLFEPETNGTSLAKFDIYPKFKAPLIQQDLIMLDEPKKGLLNLIQFQIRYVFHSLFRWCRFTIILTAAVFINLWKGPDLLLQK